MKITQLKLYAVVSRGEHGRYEIVKSLNATERRIYTIWRGGGYTDLEVRAPHSWLRIGYEDYSR